MEPSQGTKERIGRRIRRLRPYSETGGDLSGSKDTPKPSDFLLVDQT